MTGFTLMHLTIGPAGLALLALAAGLALLQLLAFTTAPASGLKTAVKTGAVAALALLGAMVGAPGLVVTGLGLGAAGDFFLSRPGERAFLAGMAAFAAGHLAYAAWFVGLGATLPALGPALAVSAVALGALIWIAPRAGALGWPVRLYILVILAMVLAALGLPGRPLAQAGALVFMASDLVLALELFVLRGIWARRAAPVVWALYWPAQVLILAAALFPPAA